MTLASQFLVLQYSNNSNNNNNKNMKEKKIVLVSFVLICYFFFRVVVCFIESLFEFESNHIIYVPTEKTDECSGKFITIS